MTSREQIERIMLKRGINSGRPISRDILEGLIDDLVKLVEKRR